MTKCVCPSQDRSCPDDCPLSIWASLGPTGRKAQRKSVAEKLYNDGHGLTMDQIATQLGVSKATISGDLANCSITEQSKPAKTKTETNPKGAGRPKGSTKTTPEPESETPEPPTVSFNMTHDGRAHDRDLAHEIGEHLRQVLDSSKAQQLLSLLSNAVRNPADIKAVVSALIHGMNDLVPQDLELVS